MNARGKKAGPTLPRRSSGLSRARRGRVHSHRAKGPSDGDRRGRQTPRNVYKTVREAMAAILAAAREAKG